MIASAPASSASPPKRSWTTSSPPSPPTAWWRPATGSIRKAGNNYMVTVQYANRWIDNMSMEDLKNIPLRGKPMRADRLPCSAARGAIARIGSVHIRQINTPTEVDHNQIRRVIDIYVATQNRSPAKGRRRNRQTGRQHPHDRNTRHRCPRRRRQHEHSLPRLRPRPASSPCARLPHPHGAIHARSSIPSSSSWPSHPDSPAWCSSCWSPAAPSTSCRSWASS